MTSVVSWITKKKQYFFASCCRVERGRRIFQYFLKRDQGVHLSALTPPVQTKRGRWQHEKYYTCRAGIWLLSLCELSCVVFSDAWLLLWWSV